ncbi:hypothetical protein Y032_0016g3022 [Ancylostoma ceylanicum]|uniref:Uncharacterized protein n=1 Tax=Ancylostoma ceylanicum TaxID=53326 RepID=A0A016V5I2_9BILA|nr:hypothetical protein Y032_0016g3022 [Ancylostoma ceylanicum]
MVATGALRRVPRCDMGVPAFKGETGLILCLVYASIHRGFLSYMPFFLPYAYFLIIPFPTLCPFHLCLNEPPTFCLHEPVDPYHLTTTTTS